MLKEPTGSFIYHNSQVHLLQAADKSHPFSFRRKVRFVLLTSTLLEKEFDSEQKGRLLFFESVYNGNKLIQEEGKRDVIAYEHCQVHKAFIDPYIRRKQ